MTENRTRYVICTDELKRQIAHRRQINKKITKLRRELALTAWGVVAYQAGSRHEWAVRNYRNKLLLIEEINRLEKLPRRLNDIMPEVP